MFLFFRGIIFSVPGLCSGGVYGEMNLEVFFVLRIELAFCSEIISGKKQLG